jgi:hypothetical protein
MLQPHENDVKDLFTQIEHNQLIDKLERERKITSETASLAKEEINGEDTTILVC